MSPSFFNFETPITILQQFGIFIKSLRFTPFSRLTTQTSNEGMIPTGKTTIDRRALNTLNVAFPQRHRLRMHDQGLL